MGETFINIIPSDSELIPDKCTFESAKQFARSALEPEDIKTKVWVKPQLVIGGEISHIIECPACGSCDHTSSFFESFSDFYIDKGFEKYMSTPCCGENVQMNDLSFVYDGYSDEDKPYEYGGFAKFCLECRDPKKKADNKTLTEFSELLGCPVRSVLTHL